MLAPCAAVVLCAAADSVPRGPDRTYVVEGLVVPPAFSQVTISAITTPGTSPYSSSAAVYWDGKFRFKNLQPGTYSVSVHVPRYGEFRRTYSVGPSTSDEKGRVRITMVLNPSKASRIYSPKEKYTVSAVRLSVSEKARHEVQEGMKRLAKNDIEGATTRFEKAIEISPQYSAAWNQLGTIAYHQKNYELAEERFREAVRLDVDSFTAVLNLGGTLLKREKLDEALVHNKTAAERRPTDAMANSQLGHNYMLLGKMELAVRHLREAERLDPAHFTDPQLSLAEIYLRVGDRKSAAAELESFLRYRPEYQQAENIRTAIRRLKTP